MPNLPISGLTASAANAVASDILPVVQTTGVGPVKMTIQQVVAGILGSSTISGTTVTTSQPLLNLAQTWNDGAVSFTAMRLNVTNTASAAASYLFDYQVGGVTRLRLTTAGILTVGTLPGIADGSGGTLNITNSGTTVANFGNANLALVARGLSMGASLGAQDVILSRKGAASLQFGAADAAAPIAQTLSVQSVVAGTSNTAGANLTITGSQGTGTGAGGSIIFQIAPAGSSGTAQNALASVMTINPDRSVTIGDNSGTAGRLNIGVALSQGLFFGNRGSIGTVADGVIVVRDNATTSFGRFCFGGTTSSFPALKRSTTILQSRLADDSDFAPLQGRLTTETAYTAGAPTATGYLIIYDSIGTAYRVPAVAN